MRAPVKILFLSVVMLAAGLRLAAQTPVVGIDYNKAAYTHQYFDLSAHYGAYWGWERAGDFPNTLRLRCDVGDAAKWYVRPYVEYQHGFKDWPFDLFRVGVSYSLDLVSRWKNR